MNLVRSFEIKYFLQWLAEGDAQMRAVTAAKSAEWGFDFDADRPLEQPSPTARVAHYELVSAAKVR